MSQILLRNVYLYGFEQQISQEASPGQFVYNFSQTEMYLKDYSQSDQQFYHPILKKFLTNQELDAIKQQNNKQYLDITQEKKNNVIKALTAAIITRVIDGDTIIVQFSDEVQKQEGIQQQNGLEKNEQIVRLIGVNAPEDTSDNQELFGPEATVFTNQYVGATVYLERDVDNVDQYGRLLRYVWLSAPSNVGFDQVMNNTLNGLLARNGLARSMSIWPNVKYSYILDSIIATAKKANIGIFSY